QWSIVRVDEVIHYVLAILTAHCVAIQFEQNMELLRTRITDLDLVWNAAEECLINQFFRLKVRRKDNQLLERHLNLFAVGQREEVMPMFKRDNPAIQELIGRDSLAAEVIEQETAAVALHLQRRF